LEGRSIPGGGCTTEQLIPQEAPSFKFNPCAVNHLFIFLGSVIQELELQKYGLKYLVCDPVVFYHHPDGKYFLAHKSVEKTCAEIAHYSQHDPKNILNMLTSGNGLSHLPYSFLILLVNQCRHCW
jgi:beta-carotene ketolase (CrtO type)